MQGPEPQSTGVLSSRPDRSLSMLCSRTVLFALPRGLDRCHFWCYFGWDFRASRCGIVRRRVPGNTGSGDRNLPRCRASHCNSHRMDF
jgi:hypothetical protein